MNDFISSWKMHTKAWIDADLHNVQTFKYEDMISRPMETFTEILKHIGIDADPERVKYALDAVEISKLREREIKEGFIESSPKNKDGFFGKGGTQWHTILKPYQIKRVEKIAGHYLEQFGYKGRLVA